ncbi:phosphotransferase [Paenibacillus sp. J31TS4]|uniref:phosphotransferase family protein n=1 Tax=Paenibacillus sp. J31TS4 TaxID=2807195 RepID=UPI001B1599C5|nr:aminoglycoside phosphotransferase family protein [Paenibacillus sp. J31TS4]GIP38435.1 phosphotransferase [Paenibacillus sp. J31TS4]
MSKLPAILREFGLEAAAVHPVPDSHSSEVYRVELRQGGDVYVKLPFNREKVYREQAMLGRLKGRLPVPEVLGLWEGDEETAGALLLSPVPGRQPAGVFSPELAHDIGRTLARLHAVEMPGYGTDGQAGFRPLAQPDWRAYIRANFAVQLAEAEPLLGAELAEACRGRFEALFAGLPPQDGPCAVHFDFRPGNLLVDGDRVTGVLDFESSRGGSSEIDFTKVEQDILAVHPGTREAFASGYASVRPLPDLERILPFYSFYESVGGVAWCQRRGADKNRAFLETNIAALQKLLL